MKFIEILVIGTIIGGLLYLAYDMVIDIIVSWFWPKNEDED